VAVQVFAHGGSLALQSPGTHTPVFSSRAELVVVHVTVTDRQGAYVSGLPQEAFHITEDGAPQQVDFFSGEDSPVTVGLLVDSSASMREGRERVIAAATAFAAASSSEDELFARTTFETATRLAMSRRIRRATVGFVEAGST
jgi:VWFA-related protein